MKNLIIICGAPCSGKGTQSKRLAEALGYHHISTGDLIRTSTREDLKEIISSGALLSDEQMDSLLEDEINRHDNIILDGYPRTSTQVTNLGMMFQKSNHSLRGVVYIKVREEDLWQRMVGRNDERNDDNAERFRVRLEKFKESTQPTIENILFFCPNYFEVDGNRNISEVAAEIQQFFQNEQVLQP
jgi:adenylate kinase